MHSTIARDTARKPVGKQQSRIWLGVSAGLLVAALALSAATLLRPMEQVSVFPDGTRLTLHGITTAPPHELTIGAWWQQLFEGVLPPGQRPRHAALAAPAVAGNMPVLWFSHTELPIAAQRMVDGGWVDPRPELLDESGYRLPSGFHVHLNGMRDPQRVRYLELGAFPRRGRVIHVRFYDGQTRRPLSDFVIPNPDPGPHPTWTAEPLPAARADGPLSVSLTSLQSGIGWRDPDQPASPGDLGRARASFRIREHGEPTRDWEPVAVTLSDATGNRAENIDSRVRRKPEETSLDFDSSLSPDESAWKLRFEFSRTARAHLEPDEFVDVRNVPVPAPNQKTGTAREVTVQGVRLRFDGVTGRTPYWFRPRVHVTLLTPLGDRRLTVLVTDQKGRTFAAYDTLNDGLSPRKRTDYALYVNLPADAKILHLRIGVHRSRFFEFTARATPAG
ncbi:MAG TPA: hypothetical protein VK689_04395 [Armatimonadota bacterium]|nr:hypothetical protein [Armatimonadota bacterium]